jgi:hypothetical protein
MEARPDAGQEAGRLGVTLPEIYAGGRYRLTVSLRALHAPSDLTVSVAGVRILASGEEAFTRRWDILGRDLPVDGQYHRFSFEFDNPRQQALTFVLDYPAVVGVRADAIVIAPVR